MVNNEQRRRQLAREKFERQQRRRAQARSKARRRNAVLASGLVLLLAAGATAYAAGGLGGGDEKAGADAAPSASPGKAPDPCAKPAPGAPKNLQWKKEPALTIDTSASYTMELRTTCGDITLGLDADKAPRTVNSFNFLAGKGYFDHTKCHRLTSGGVFVLQCGDPKGTGAGDPGYTIPDENLKDPKLSKKIYPAGTVAMANRYDAKNKKNRNSGGSQFFLVYQDSQLPPDYTPFGTIDGGKDALKKIVDAGAEAQDQQTGNTAPNATVVINKAVVKKS
ncbi:peptidylprolyl isomerase [Streptomyces sp. H27-D2]|uniref:peptidylprolyl isomerase n=1 Tax=Streptomyces sp. H27-D2 TaxID=3046304 RepID=UPI002DB5CDA6|nr:peptidylprolyl isomerase [Streptomyces sp. H27-D2]MEC4015572.1 peptidylprolyl isomerase [Streptomyces sp. H27-D2]